MYISLEIKKRPIEHSFITKISYLCLNHNNVLLFKVFYLYFFVILLDGLCKDPNLNILSHKAVYYQIQNFLYSGRNSRPFVIRSFQSLLLGMEYLQYLTGFPVRLTIHTNWQRFPCKTVYFE